ncbi:unnamed protein product [Psylliodes chrysocephalus]|uniref:Uncharacterized protein n=1 Tax=Psylliodes chrysocephalus TaxID=3402493 RepID=A0A9P0CWP4_9CUCU|nr:unnamed protein product [Psylliodes chrysocephala]
MERKLPQYQCFEQVAKLFLTTRRDWKCKSCSDFDNTNTPDDLTSLKYQVSYLKRENELLIDLNTELKQNNELLKQNNFELSDKIATQNNLFLPIHAGTTSTVSYSNVLQKTMNNKVTPFTLVIKSTNKENSNIDILSDIQRRVKLADLNVCINSTKQIKKGVVPNCEDELSLEKLKTSIQKKVGSSYNISESQKYNPRLIIKHMQVDSSLESHEDIIKNMFSINQLEPFTTEDLKIVTILKYSHSKSQDVIIEVCPKLRKQILERSYLYLGWKRCSVSDYIRVIRCYQCSGNNRYTTEDLNKTPLENTVHSAPTTPTHRAEITTKTDINKQTIQIKEIKKPSELVKEKNSESKGTPTNNQVITRATLKEKIKLRNNSNK